MVLLAERGVLIESDFSIERDDLTRLGENQWVYLHQGGIFFFEDFVKLHHDRSNLVNKLRGELCRDRDLLGLLQVDASNRVDLDAGQRVGALLSQLFNFHAALVAAQCEVGAVGAVQEHGEVKLLGNLGTGGHHHASNHVTFNVEAQNTLGRSLRLIRSFGDLHTTGLASATGLHLGFDDGDATHVTCGLEDLIGGVGDLAGEHGNTVRFEHVSSLILK